MMKLFICGILLLQDSIVDGQTPPVKRPSFMMGQQARPTGLMGAQQSKTTPRQAPVAHQAKTTPKQVPVAQQSKPALPTTHYPLLGSPCFCGLANRLALASRIVGGAEAEVNEFPWQGGFLPSTGGKVFCGGSVISDQWILTAAHCAAHINEGLRGASNVQVILGDHNYQISNETKSLRSSVSQMIIHPQYNKSNTNYDFALIQLAAPINFTEWPTIRPICLPESDANNYKGNIATVAGWGTISSGGNTTAKLMKVDVTVLNQSICETLYKPNLISSQMLCAAHGGRDSCQGDSGGPLITSGTGNGVFPGQNNELIGVVSWGIGCADPRYPGIYARVSKQLPWIRATIASSKTCPRS